MVLPAALFAWLDLASPASRFAGRPALPGNVLSVQALESRLALAHSPRADGDGLAAAGRMDAPPPRAISPTIGRGFQALAGTSRDRGDRWGVVIGGESPAVTAVRISADSTFVSYP